MSSRSLIIGSIWMLVTSFAVASVAALAKVAGKAVPSSEILFFGNAIAFLLIAPFVLRHGWSGAATKHPGLHLVRGLAGCISWYLWFLSLHWVPLIDATLMNNTSQLWLPFLLWIWMKQRPAPRVWGGVLLGLIGVGLVLHPGREAFHPAILLALGSSFGLAIAFLAVHAMATTERLPVILFFYFLFSAVATSPLLVLQWRMPGPAISLVLLVIGILMAMMQLTLSLSFRTAPVWLVSPLFYMTVVFTAVLDWVFWHHVPDWLAVTGALLVISGCTWTILGHQGDRDPAKALQNVSS